MELLFCRFWNIPRKAQFSKVTALSILLKQDPTTDVFVNTFQNSNIFHVTPLDGCF